MCAGRISPSMEHLRLERRLPPRRKVRSGPGADSCGAATTGYEPVPAQPESR